MAEDSSASDKQETSKNEGSVKETIESILVAFILAFVFRAFVVEAFVIPTGSMGPTLMGAHLRLQCPDCGFQFPVSFPKQSAGDDTDIPATATFQQGFSATCPNCGYQIPLGGVQPVYFGDRILVLKYRYLFSQPDRWDVVVFKSPYEQSRDPNDPKYADNYIKRLVGLPNESIMILDGDVYVGHKGLPPEQFQIQRKPDYAQRALWQAVYDNDYLPHEDRIGWQDPWTVENGTGWKGPQGGGPPQRTFQFDNAHGASAIYFDSRVNHPFDALSDWIGYDQNSSGAYVSDLKLSCVYRRSSGQGPLELQLTKRDDCFTVDFLPGKVQLRRTKLLDSEPLKFGKEIWPTPKEVAVPELDSSGRPIEIEFTNVDYVVSVRVNGRVVLTTTDADYKPDVKTLYQEAIDSHFGSPSKPIVRINAANQASSLEHLRLARDVYYINRGNHYTAEAPPRNPNSNESYWGSPENIMNLGPDEYFVLGDNSQVSLDARFWGAPVNLPHEDYEVGAGRVPGRFMLGKAFFVYWPAGYRFESLPYGIRPDFGDMRFIH